jgi:plasmid stabilization system protein ParE
MTFDVELSAQARREVEEMCDWIAERSPEGARRWYECFWELVDEIKRRANTYSVAEESATLSMELRQAIFHTRRGNRYRALFVVEGPNVRIVTVRGPGQPPIESADLKPD